MHTNGNGRSPHPGATAPQEATMPATGVATDTIEAVDLSARTPTLLRHTLEMPTERAFDVIDVTDACHALLAASGVRDGHLSVFTPHTTCAVKINEKETCFLEDLQLFMDALVPPDAYYRHDDFEIRDPATLATTAEDEPINGHAHVKQMLLGSSSETIPVVDGRLGLGQWQRVMFIELDQPRARRVTVQVQGWR